MIEGYTRSALSLRTKVFAFADPVKHAAMALVGMPIEVACPSDYTKPVGENTNALREAWVYLGRNARWWLQWVGTELGREQINQDVWVDRAVDRIINDYEGTHVFIISDGRFENERVDLHRKLEERFIPYIAVRVRRPQEPVDLSHPSESVVAAMPDGVFDCVIMNDGPMDQLELDVEDFVENWVKPAYAAEV